MQQHRYHKTATVCSPINGQSLYQLRLFVFWVFTIRHNVSLLQIKTAAQTAEAGKSQKGFAALNKRRRVMKRRRNRTEKVSVWCSEWGAEAEPGWNEASWMFGAIHSSAFHATTTYMTPCYMPVLFLLITHCMIGKLPLNSVWKSLSPGNLTIC